MDMNRKTRDERRQGDNRYGRRPRVVVAETSDPIEKTSFRAVNDVPSAARCRKSSAGLG